MPHREREISPDPRRHVRRAAKAIWLVVILTAGILTGLLAARSYDAREFRESRRSAAGVEYGYTMAEIRLDHPTLRQAIDTLSRQSRAKIDVDWPALKTVGVYADTPLNFDARLHHVTLNQVLSILLDVAGGRELGYVDDQNGVRISTPDNLVATPVLKIYDARGLLQKVHREREIYGDAESNEFTLVGQVTAQRVDDETYLTSLVIDVVAPDSWINAGGTAGSIQCVDGKLVIVQTPYNFRAVDDLFAELLAKRDPSPQVVPYPVDAEEELSRNVHELWLGKVTLYQAVQALRERTGANIFVNWAQLVEAGFRADCRVDLTVKDVTLEAAIEHILATAEPHAAVPEIGIRDGMIRISTPADLGRNRYFTRLYPVGDLLNHPIRGASPATILSADHLVELVDRELAGETSKETPTSNSVTDGTGAKVWAARLVVDETRKNQHKVAAFLKTLREGK